MVRFQCHRHHIEVRGIPELAPPYAATATKTLFVPGITIGEDTLGHRFLKDVISSYKTRIIEISLSELFNISSS